MKKLVVRVILAVVTVTLVACQPSTPTTAPAAMDIFDIPWDDRSAFRAGLIASEQPVLGRLDGASVYHIDLQIADDFVHLDGRQEVRYTNQETEPLGEVYFRLFPNQTPE